MTAKTEEDLELLRDAAREVAECEKPKTKGGRYVQSAFPGGPAKKVPGVMFGARRFLPPDQYSAMAAKKAPGPKGPATEDLIADAKRRRAEARAAERAR